ncbi:hypothetical protein L249_4516 [Ophiocordyceps polyrhachis-furcata BCC 54312]|uniref:asparaginase n=1 Tax=Ophiocordyceps polyrhachis-furcata BCC 54312 TaxID=1330021 RepID=A0A367KZ95_9HYPO|nr:hypothetical protein L249_4516 [Ophiocordyceps polyrhachis-furcata BCC 54312]
MAPSQVDTNLDDDAASPAGLPESRVLIIGTGGTICMQPGPDGLTPSDGFLEKALAPRLSFNDMSGLQVQLQAFRNGRSVSLPSLRTPPTEHKRHIRYAVVEFDPLVDSSCIDASDWAAMASAVHENYHLFDGFVILHGTDSLAYTASALSFHFANLGKPVILTGSQAPIFALQSDAVDNLRGSLIIAGTFVIPEVCLFFHHKLYRGNRTTKVSAASFEAFASPNCDPLARVNGLGIDVNWSLVLRPTSIAGFKLGPPLDTTHVACLRVFPGIRAEMVDAVLRLPHLRGLILETFGMGNVPGGANGPLTSAVTAAVERGVVVVNVSQCVSGFASPVYAPGTLLGRAGVIFGLDMTAEAALAKLSYLLAASRESPLSVREMARLFGCSLRGELTEPTLPTFTHPAPPLAAAASRLTPLQAASAALGYAIQAAEPKAAATILDTDDGPTLLNMPDYAGNTPVHMAALSGSSQIMLDLLRRGGSVHARNRANNTPLFLAHLSGNDDVAQLLITAGAHLSADETERGPLAKRTTVP